MHKFPATLAFNAGAFNRSLLPSQWAQPAGCSPGQSQGQGLGCLGKASRRQARPQDPAAPAFLRSPLPWPPGSYFWKLGHLWASSLGLRPWSPRSGLSVTYRDPRFGLHLHLRPRQSSGPATHQLRRKKESHLAPAAGPGEEILRRQAPPSPPSLSSWKAVRRDLAGSFSLMHPSSQMWKLRLRQGGDSLKVTVAEEGPEARPPHPSAGAARSPGA